MNKKNRIAVVILMLFLLSGCGREKIVFESTVNEQTLTSVQDNFADSEALTKPDGADNPVETEKLEKTTAESEECYVDVGGAVCSPGVYKVDEGTRIYEVLLLAGGMTSDAEETCINQALEVYDGLKLLIPTKEEWEAGEFVINEKEIAVRKQVLQETTSAETKAQADDGFININEADVNELCTLPGIGKAKAESIIAYRQENGAFARIEDIQKVTGIKENLFQKIRAKIKV